MLGRRLGRDRARALAGAPSLAAALDTLEGTAYGRDLRPGMDLAAAQRALAETALWHLRVLAGWLPPRAVEPLRALAAWLEIVNIEDRLDYLAGGELRRPFSLGGLTTAWVHVAAAQTPGEVRAALAGSAWGDPGGEDRATIGLGLRIAWARRVLEGVEEAREWAAGALALLLARELLLAGRRAEDLAVPRLSGIGLSWREASTLAELRERLPDEAGWTLAGIDDRRQLWRGETSWWKRVEQNAERLLRSSQLGRTTVIATVALLAVDAWRSAGALEIAARGGEPDAREVFGQIA